MKRAHFISYLMPLALVGLGLTGCSQTGPSDTADEEAEASEQALPEGEGPEAGRRARHDRRGFGPEHMLREALEGIALSTDQTKAIDAAFESARPDPDARPELQAFFTELATGVRAGNIDRAALDAKLAELDKNKPDMRAKMASTLQTVHDTLTAAQRKELVANVEAKMADHPEGFQKGGDREKGDHPKGDRNARGPLGKMLKGLDLTDDQKAAIVTALEGSGMGKPDRPDREEMKAKHEEMRTKMKALLDAFPSEGFDANALLPEGPKGRGPREHLSHMVAALEVAVPILTESQRAVLAERLESGEAMKRMMHDKRGVKRHGSPKGAAGPGAEE